MATLREQDDMDHHKGQPPSPTATGMPNHEAIALLPLPERLTDQQREGRRCVWGAEPITANTSTDLGSRLADGLRIFPRACPTCLEQAALRALYEHTSNCPTCKTSSGCETGRAFARLTRGGVR